ncbi:protein arginine N-methyltransferase 7-like [Dendronephthya gigantea]|uniref:protein arginine N-methyltransferase 7-like n=1 Tax=Dendronephthya gigantea TaxID=151771 RepID=UPI001069E8F9|nr:protein arginine N-methyltransferase 7-like [Dendronephthya gigantea]
MFCKRFSPVTGKDEWCLMEENYDDRREILRSLFGDMLHDKERNKQYYRAINKEVKRFLNEGKNPHCLDIGTGTGLLSMMAAKSGIKTIFACEAFLPMATVAKEITKENGFNDSITVIPKSSLNTSIPEDMPERAEFVVMELFDTELIGEGLLPSMRHAYKHLLEKNATVVPAAATVYVQLFESETLWEMHQLLPSICDDEGLSLKIPESIKNCKGAPSVYDVQADEIPLKDFKALSKALPVLRFLFCELDEGNDDVMTERVMTDREDNEILSYLNNDSPVERHGTVHVILMWWDLQMDKDGEIILSMAPKWMDQGKAKRNEWRDHWMQGVYFIDKPLQVSKGERLSIQTTHDDYAFWFDVHPEKKANGTSTLKKRNPVCTCGAHTVWSRPRFSMVNHHKRRKQFYTLFKKLVKNGASVALVISDGSLLSVLGVMAGFKKVYVLEPEVATRRVIQQIVTANGFTDRIVLLSKTADQLTKMDIQDEVDVILGEPFFISSLVPWHDLYFWYASRSVMSNLCDHKIKVNPGSACLKAVAVELDDLWKIRAPLGSVEGFNVQAFDKLIESCRVESEENEAEPHSMWEYPCRALSDVFDVLHFDFTSQIPDEKQEVNGTIEFTRKGCCNAVIFWVDYMFDENICMSTGLTKEMETSNDGHIKNWVKFCKQGVYFIHKPYDVRTTSAITTLKYTVTFKPNDGSLTMQCCVAESF